LISVSAKELEEWKSCSYVDIVKQIVSMFVSPHEVPEDDQHGMFGIGTLDRKMTSFRQSENIIAF